MNSAFHNFFHQSSKKAQSFIDYVSSWLAPTIPQIVGKLNKNHESLLAGLNNFENIRNNPDTTVTAVIYRASGVK
ncbi:MAG: hypothetical protein QNJ60_15800 [Xenococcaceae cyanobacterium MO_188.B19]|nr:hypothetical protein [Xenococcaceae cyanobacterium MO_188.B19]